MKNVFVKLSVLILLIVMSGCGGGGGGKSSTEGKCSVNCAIGFQFESNDAYFWLVPGATYTPTVYALDENGSLMASMPDDVEFYSSDPNVISVDLKTGMLTCIGEVPTGGMISTEIAVIQPSTGATGEHGVVCINLIVVKGLAAVSVGSAVTLELYGNGQGSPPIYLQEGIWVSADPSVAIVDEKTGVVTGVSGGATTISLSLPNGISYVVATVNVSNLPQPAWKKMDLPYTRTTTTTTENVDCASAEQINTEGFASGWASCGDGWGWSATYNLAEDHYRLYMSPNETYFKLFPESGTLPIWELGYGGGQTTGSLFVDWVARRAEFLDGFHRAGVRCALLSGEDVGLMDVRADGIWFLSDPGVETRLGNVPIATDASPLTEEYEVAEQYARLIYREDPNSSDNDGVDILLAGPDNGSSSTISFQNFGSNNPVASGSCEIMPTYSISVQTKSLDGTVVLQNNIGDELTISGTWGSYTSATFATRLPEGMSYDVSVLTQPAGDQICRLDGGSGTVSTSNVDNLYLTCSLPELTFE